jgi:hypothetical protein
MSLLMLNNYYKRTMVCGYISFNGLVFFRILNKRLLDQFNTPQSIELPVQDF